jgi:hypothetical protein
VTKARRRSRGAARRSLLRPRFCRQIIQAMDPRSSAAHQAAEVGESGHHVGGVRCGRGGISAVLGRGRGCSTIEGLDGRARAVLRRSRDEAATLSHPCLGTEHLLLGLLGEEGDPPRVDAPLARSGVELPVVREMLAALCPPGDRVVEGPLPLSPRLRSVIGLAGREAVRHGDEEIGPRHLLAAILIDGWGVAVYLVHGARVDTTALLERARTTSDQVTGARR